jgi:1-deoxy-D-xylulose-5-phosphate synthase
VLDKLEQEGIKPAHFDVRFLKPLDESALNVFAEQYPVWITVEDGTEKGGLFSEISEFLDRRDDLRNLSTTRPHLMHIALPDQFITHGDIPNLYKEVGFDENSMENMIKKAWGRA